MWAAPGGLSDADFFQFVAASLGDGVLVIDTGERIVYANPAAETILGAPLPVGPFRAWSAAVERADGATPYPYDELPPVRAARGESPPSADVVLRAASGALYISMTSRPLRDRAGNLIGSVTIFRDVSSQRLAQEELARAGTFLDSIVENIPDMIFVKEARNLTFERFNRAGEELWA